MNMNARIHYLSILKDPLTQNTQSSKISENIRTGLRDWILFREYWNPNDSMEEFAGKLGATKDEIASYLRLRTGRKYLAIRKELRISDAQELVVRNPGMAVYEIGRMVGISDKSNFRKEFTEIVGVTPSSWRACGGSMIRYRVSLLQDTMRNHCLSARMHR